MLGRMRFRYRSSGAVTALRLCELSFGKDGPTGCMIASSTKEKANTSGLSNVCRHKSTREDSCASVQCAPNILPRFGECQSAERRLGYGGGSSSGCRIGITGHGHCGSISRSNPQPRSEIRLQAGVVRTADHTCERLDHSSCPDCMAGDYNERCTDPTGYLPNLGLLAGTRTLPQWSSKFTMFSFGISY
jgi:hypothetical protein